jgi:hypothetical protein
MSVRVALLGIFSLATAAAHADPGATAAGTVLVRFDGGAWTPKDVLTRLKGQKEMRYEVRYAPKNEIAQYEPVKPVSWALRFGAVEDPKTHGRYLRDLSIVLLENSELVCRGGTDSLVVGMDKISFADDPVRAAMMVNVNVSCARARDGYVVGCGGTVEASGKTPTGCNPTPVAKPAK